MAENGLPEIGTSPDIRRGVGRIVFYLDANTDFTLDGQDWLITDDVAVNNQIANLLLTVIGSDHFEPEFGSAIPELLWDPTDDVTAWRMETAAFNAIKRWMSSRIRLNHGLCKITTLMDMDGFNVSLAYTIINNQSIGYFNARLFR